MQAKILIMAGGTGGHVFPGLAVAEELRNRGLAVFWLGTRQGLEARLVPKSGFKIRFIRVSGLRGKGVLKKLTAPLVLFFAFLQSLWVILQSRPQVVLGMGGGISGPGGVAAWVLRKPLLIHEQNAVPGMTNRLLARLADGVMEAFPGSFKDWGLAPARFAVQHTGNPVHSAIAALPPPLERLRRTTDPSNVPSDESLRILVLGGSQGAVSINRVVADAVRESGAPGWLNIRHQVGSKHLDEAEAYYGEQATVQLIPFIDDMAEAYAWADLVVGRAGAMTVSELAVAGVGAILVPYPSAVDDHQTANARFLADVGAAILLPQPELSPYVLCKFWREFHDNRDQLLAMAEAARAMAMPNATERVSARCLEVASLHSPSGNR